MFIAYMLEFAQNFARSMLTLLAHNLTLHENTYVLTLFCHRTIREPFSLMLPLM